MSISLTLGEIADQIGAQLHGDAECQVNGVGTLEHAVAGQIGFLSNTRYRQYLEATSASAVILSAEYLDDCKVHALVCPDPYLAYARAAQMLNPRAPAIAGLHATVVMSESARVDKTACIGARVVIADDVQIDAGVSIGAGCVIGNNVHVGSDTRIHANVTLQDGSVIGQRVVIHPGVVIGSDGFGIANDSGRWVNVPQLGNVIVGDDVDIGANTTIDRGALGDTVIENGVKLDNQIQVGHNVRIGANTAIAACTGISGSTSIGQRCIIGGAAAFAGHLEIADDVMVTGRAMVTKSITKAGVYSSGIPAQENSKWRKNIAYMHKLEEIYKFFRQSRDSSDEK